MTSYVNNQIMAVMDQKNSLNENNNISTTAIGIITSDFDLP